MDFPYASKELSLEMQRLKDSRIWNLKIHKRFWPGLSADLCLCVVTAVSSATSGSAVSTETWDGNCATQARGGSGKSPWWPSAWWGSSCCCCWGSGGLTATGDCLSLGIFNLSLPPPKGMPASSRWTSTHLLHLFKGGTNSEKENKQWLRISLLWSLSGFAFPCLVLVFVSISTLFMFFFFFF